MGVDINMKNFYIFRNGELKRKDNDVVIISDSGEKKNLKSEIVEEIYLFGEVTTNTNLLNYLAQKKIILHVFNYYGFYSGSFYPKETQVSGFLLVRQVQHYNDYNLRMNIAREIVRASAANIYRNLRYYNSRGKDFKQEMQDILNYSSKIQSTQTINELMGLEGNINKKYLSCWNEIINQEINYTKRIKRPPDNMINSLISFINSLVYTTVLSEIYKTQLNPTVSYLHEPGTRRFSLCLDLAEIFKPLIGDRMIFTLLNKNQITEESFESGSNYVYLKENARKMILQEFDNRLKATIKHKDLGRQVSYRTLIRLEAYKLIKHIIGEKEYEGFTIWW